MKDLKCMSFTSKGTAEIIAAGLQNSMFVIDLIKGEVVKQVRKSHEATPGVSDSNCHAGSNGPSILDYETRALYMRSYERRISTPFGSHHLRHRQNLECSLSLNQ